METVFDVVFEIMYIAGLLATFVVLAIFVKQIFTPLVHWDKNEQQIMAGKRCLFDSRTFNKTRVGLTQLEEGFKEFKEFKCQVDCGHKMKFKEKTCARYPYPSPLFVFRCCLCDYEEERHEKDLSIEEKRALKKLGLL